MLSSILTLQSIAAIVAGLLCLISVVLIYVSSKRRGRASIPANPPGIEGDNLESNRLILDTLERSNVLLWWAQVSRIGKSYDWKFRTPQQLHDNQIYRLSSTVEKGSLWTNEQSPEHERMEQNATRALAEGRSGYQQEFPIIGRDGMHWLSEEVVIRPMGPNEWRLAGVIIDITKRREAEEAREATESQLGRILDDADCLLWQAKVTGDPEIEIKWNMWVPPSSLFKRIFGEGHAAPQKFTWTEDIVPELPEMKRTARRALRDGKAGYEQEFHIVKPGYTLCVHERVSITLVRPGVWNLVGVIVDVTENRRIEEALQRSKERLSLAVEAANDGLWD